MVNHSGSAATLDASFQALAHPVRRAIVRRLAQGPASVAEAARGTGASKPAVTKHLHVLERAGIVNRAVTGRTHVLSLAPTPLADAGDWIEGQRKLWERKFDVIADYLEETA